MSSFRGPEEEFTPTECMLSVFSTVGLHNLNKKEKHGNDVAPCCAAQFSNISLSTQTKTEHPHLATSGMSCTSHEMS